MSTVEVSTQRFEKAPLKNYTPIVPQIRSVNENRIMILNIDGKEFKSVLTRPAMPGIELIVLNGLKTLKTLTDDTFSY